MGPTDDMIDSAKFYAALGYPIFPCLAGDKRPLTSKGFLDASTDVGQLDKWWREHPNANIGLPCAGLIVIDVDGSSNDYCQRFAGVECPVSQTPRGGRHYVFRKPDGLAVRNSVGKLAPKVDIRTDGGYVCV